MRRVDLLVLALIAIAFVLTQWTISSRQVDTEVAVQATARAAQATARAVQANCVVISVLLSNRADRDKTIKLFEPIRRENPEQFDALVKKAEDGDKRLAQVQGDLACLVAEQQYPGHY